MVPVRDGVKLFTSIYEPKDRSKTYPILLSRTPYSVAPYGADKFKSSLGPDIQFAREGYIFVYQDVRGRWMSEGKFVDVRPEVAQYKKAQIDESTDTYDSIDWLIKNVANNNGRVGTYGISYPGFYTSAGAINSHPALKACSPQAPVSDWFHGDDMHHNGAVFLAQNYWFYTFFQPFLTPSNDGSNMRKWQGTKSEDSYNYFLDLGGMKEISDSFMSGIGTRQLYWDEQVSHSTYDAYWQDRNVLPKLNGIKCATMTVGGWYDNEDLYGALNTYQHIEKQNPGIFNVLVVGPWFHGGWVRADGDWLGTAFFGSKTSEYYQKNIQLPFFDHFLKDKGDISNIKEVNVFDTGSGQWRDLDNFTPATSKATPLYLTSSGGLSFDRPKTSGHDEYVSDPMHPVPYTQKITKNYPREFMTEDQRFAATRPDVLVYKTAPLDADMTIAGDIDPSLFVSSTGTDSDFVVKLIDVFPDDFDYPEGAKPPANYFSSVFEPGGYQMLLRGEPMPARFRNGFEKGVPLTANEVTPLKFTMPGVMHTFKKGHRIMVQIQSTWFPLVARNPQQFVVNQAVATKADFRKVTNRVYYGGRDASAIILQVEKR